MDFANQSKAALRATFVAFLIGFFLSVFVSAKPWHEVAEGATFGMAGSLWIVWSMMRQTQATVDKAQSRLRRSPYFWMASRFAVAGVVVLFARRMQFNLYAAAAGLMVGFIVVMVDGFLRYWRMRA